MDNGLNFEDLTLVMAPAKCLRTPGIVVQTAPDEHLIKKMGRLMVNVGGAGLAANQVGINSTFFIAKFDGKLTLCINPKIVNHGKQELETPEGCLSIRDKKGKIIYRPNKRWAVIDVSYSTMDGHYGFKIINCTLKRWEAKLFQHEMDHMEGKLCNEKNP